MSERHGRLHPLGEADTDFAVDDQMLVNALAQEQEYEKENVVEDAQALAEQLGVGKTWEVSDRPGGDIVTLTRKFGSES